MTNDIHFSEVSQSDFEAYQADFEANNVLSYDEFLISAESQAPEPSLNEPYKQPKRTVFGNVKQELFCKTATKDIVLFAPPGSGKTKSIVLAIDEYFQQFPDTWPNTVLAITFTNAATNELRSRIKKSIDIHTFHAFARKVIMLQTGFYPNVITQDDINMIMKNIIKELNYDCKDRELYSLIKLNPKEHADAVSMYNQQKTDYMVMDFDDLIEKATIYLQESAHILDYCVIFVDESQDISQAQFDFIVAIKNQNCQPIMKLVGDPNQSIMGFAGAMKGVMTKIAHHFSADIMQLTETYRSCKQVVASYQPFAIMPTGDLSTHNLENGSVEKMSFRNEYNERDFITKQIKTSPEGTTFGILTRTKFSLSAIENALVSNGIPCQAIGAMSFYSYKEIDILISLLKFYLNPKDKLSGLKFITQFPDVGQKTGNKLLIQYEQNPESVPEIDNPLKNIAESVVSGSDSYDVLKSLFDNFNLLELKYFKKDTEKTTEDRLNRINELMEKGKGVELADFIYTIQSTKTNEEQAGNVSLSTMHSSKGLEYDVVFIVGFEEGSMPFYKADTKEEIEEERCLAYVSLSRSKLKTFVTTCKTRYRFNKQMICKPSPWLSEIG